MKKLTPAYYFTIQGRISRFEYWIYFQLPIFVLSVLFSVLGSLADSLAAISGILTLVLFIPSIVAGIRRFHDRNKSGWWMLIAFIPLVGAIWLLVELGFLKGTDGANNFGSDPVPLLTA